MVLIIMEVLIMNTKISAKKFFKIAVEDGVNTFQDYKEGKAGKRKTIIRLLIHTRRLYDNTCLSKGEKKLTSNKIWKDITPYSNTNIWTAMNIAVHGCGFINDLNNPGDPKIIKNCNDPLEVYEFFKESAEYLCFNKRKFKKIYENIFQDVPEDCIGIC